MYDLLKSWGGKVSINGKEYNSISDAKGDFNNLKDDICIVLHSKTVKSEQNESKEEATTSNTRYLIEVKPYMMKKATPSFDFMAKWNNDNPMPLKIMVGTIEKETRGMVYMKLHAELLEKQTQRCLCCGKVITNPVSQYFGMGGVCGGHNYVNPFNSDEELKAAVEKYKAEVLSKKTWEGWIIRSAIISKEAIE